MSATPRSSRVTRRRAGGRVRLVWAAVLLALVAPACSGGGSAGDELPFGLGRPRPADPGPPPTLAGRVELPDADPVAALVGDGLAFGAALPSADAALDELRAAPETGEVLLRTVHDAESTRHLGDLVVATLEGSAFHDEASVDVWVEGLVAALGEAPAREVELAGEPVVRSTRQGRAAVGYRSGGLLAVVQGPAPEATLVLTRIIGALGVGVTGDPVPATPVVDLPADWAFVPVPGVEFVPFPPVEEEDPPTGPLVAGMLGAEGRIGVVGGERRSTVWSIPTDPAMYPSAESLLPAAEALAESRVTGAPARLVELGDRLVAAADSEGDGEGPSARVFSLGRLLVLVEGHDPAQLDAVVSAWIAVLS